jgi:hypothetical protein
MTSRTFILAVTVEAAVIAAGTVLGAAALVHRHRLHTRRTAR